MPRAGSQVPPLACPSASPGAGALDRPGPLGECLPEPTGLRSDGVSPGWDLRRSWRLDSRTRYVGHFGERASRGGYDHGEHHQSPGEGESSGRSAALLTNSANLGANRQAARLPATTATTRRWPRPSARSVSRSPAFVRWDAMYSRFSEGCQLQRNAQKPYPERHCPYRRNGGTSHRTSYRAPRKTSYRAPRRAS